MRAARLSLPQVNDRGISAGHFQLGRAYLRFAPGRFTVERPLQHVALELIRALQRLPEHGDLRSAVLVELGRDLNAPLPGFPLANDQVLRAGKATG